MTIGDQFPRFDLEAAVSLEQGKEFKRITDTSHPGQWQVVFFWPMDFAARDAQLLGASTDSHFVHLAWRRDHKDLRDLPFPMLADVKRELSSALGILHQDAGVALRATFIVDPQGVIRWVSANDLSVGRNVDEVLRTLDALQTDELCPCNWKQGDDTLKAA